MGFGLFDDQSALPFTTSRGIPYEVDALSYRETWRPSSSRTVVTCRVKTSQAFDWVTDMVGRVSVDPVTGLLRRDLPEVNPFDSKQRCTGLEQVDQGEVDPDAGTIQDDLGNPTFADSVSAWPVTRWMRYRASFEAMPFELRDDAYVDGKAPAGWERELLRYVVRARKTVAREQQIPGGGFKVIAAAVADRVLLMTTNFKTLVFGDVTYTWVRVPVGRLPPQAISHEGKINDAVFDPRTLTTNPAGYDFPAGTLLYTGFDDTQKYYDANEDWVCDVVYNFRYKQIGWNKYLNNLGAAVEVSSDGTAGGTKPYTTANFNQLFRAG